MPARVGLSLLATNIAAVCLGGAAIAQELSAEIGKNARLRDCGVAALVPVTVTCPAGGEVLEAFVYVNQQGVESQFAPLAVVCDGAPHVLFGRSALLEGTFQPGAANASAYVLLTSGESVSPSAQINLFR